MLLVYRLITALLAALVILVCLRERSWTGRVTAGMVLVPLLLRLFLLK